MIPLTDLIRVNVGMVVAVSLFRRIASEKAIFMIAAS